MRFFTLLIQKYRRWRKPRQSKSEQAFVADCELQLDRWEDEVRRVLDGHL